MKIKWRKLNSYQFSDLERAKFDIESRIKENLENYSRKTSVKERDTLHFHIEVFMT